MKKLVLDKSALVATRRGILSNARLRFAFLLTDTLLHEIVSEKATGRHLLDPRGLGRLEGRIRANIDKIVNEAGNAILQARSAITWELATGTPASLCLEDRLPRLESADRFALKHAEDIAQYDAGFAYLAQFRHHRDDEEAFQNLRKLHGDEDLFRQLESDLQALDVACRAKASYSQLGKAEGINIAVRFRPRRNWFCYGMEAASYAFLAWKFARHGDGPADTKKPPNPAFDFTYVAFMAIADGLLSCDNTMLNLAWACWPDKRANIHWYDAKAHDIVPFLPGWET